MIPWEVLIPTIGSIAICMINNIHQNNVTRKIFEIKIDSLERKVEKHNQVIERTYELEKHDRVEQEQIKHILEHIERLEKA